MANGNQIDVVVLASDALHEVNMTLAALLPGEPGYDALEQKRDELEARLKRLVRGFIADNTKRFISADGQLVAVNQRMKADLRSLQSLQEAIDAVTNLINALDSFISTVFPVPA
jgi:hypothetical protein